MKEGPRGSGLILWQHKTVIYILSHVTLEPLQKLHQFNHIKCPVFLRIQGHYSAQQFSCCVRDVDTGANCVLIKGQISQLVSVIMYIQPNEIQFWLGSLHNGTWRPSWGADGPPPPDFLSTRGLRLVLISEVRKSGRVPTPCDLWRESQPFYVSYFLLK